MMRLAMWVLCGAVAGCGLFRGPAPEFGGPAELPPEGYASRQYVDSRGCLFVRVGPPGAPNWVPEVGADRRPLCGARPSLEVETGDSDAAEAARVAAAASPTASVTVPATPPAEADLIADGIVPDPVVAAPPGPPPQAAAAPAAPPEPAPPQLRLRENFVQVTVFPDIGSASALVDALRRNAYQAQIRQLRIRGEIRQAVVIGPLASDRLVAGVVDDMRAAGFDAFAFVSQ